MRTLSVSDVRNEVYWAAGGPRSAGGGATASPLLGTIFHQTFAGLTGADEQVNLVRALQHAEPERAQWQRDLTAHAYEWHVAPALEKNQRELQGHAASVMTCWSAVQNLSIWLADLMWEQTRGGTALQDARKAVFAGAEVDVAVTLRDDSWSEPVMIRGRLDALLRQPRSGARCVLELKSGKSAPEADLCQAALYHLLLDTKDVALLSFSPEPHEQRFGSDQLRDAQQKIKALIGRMAEVTPAERKTGVDPAPHGSSTGSKPGSASKGTAEAIIRALKDAGIQVRLDGEPMIGPTFIRFFIDTSPGVKPESVVKLESTLWTRLRTSESPQISIVHGRLVVDVERPDREIVYWRYLKNELAQPSSAGCSRFPVGVAIDGALHWVDFARPEHAHLLAAGTTGSGKSEWLRAMIASLLVQNTPATLRLLLIDPKRTGFHIFEGSPFLYAPVVYPDDSPVTEILELLILEMERRYQSFAAAGVSKLAEYNRICEPMPLLITVCDEYSDLVIGDRTRGREIQRLVGRLAAKGRAAGLHLVFATQRPSREVVSGVIDTNLPARVCLRVAKPLESRIIIGEPGGATLLGRGDLLFRDLGKAVRLQSPFLEELELRDLLATPAGPS